MAKKITVLFKGLLTALLIFSVQGLWGQNFILDTLKLDEITIKKETKTCYKSFATLFENSKIQTHNQSVSFEIKKTFNGETPKKNIEIEGAAEVQKKFLSRNLKLKNIKFDLNKQDTVDVKKWKEDINSLVPLGFYVWKILNNSVIIKKYFNCHRISSNRKQWLFTGNHKFIEKVNKKSDTIQFREDEDLRFYAKFSLSEKLESIELKSPTMAELTHRIKTIKVIYCPTDKGIEINRVLNKEVNLKNDSVTRLTIDF